MKVVTRTTPRLAFHYRGTKKSRDSLVKEKFCKRVEHADESTIWVWDGAQVGGARYYVETGDWIIVEDSLIVNVIDSDMFEDQYTVVGEVNRV